MPALRDLAWEEIRAGRLGRGGQGVRSGRPPPSRTVHLQRLTPDWELSRLCAPRVRCPPRPAEVPRAAAAGRDTGRREANRRGAPLGRASPLRSVPRQAQRDTRPGSAPTNSPGRTGLRARTEAQTGAARKKKSPK